MCIYKYTFRFAKNPRISVKTWWVVNFMLKGSKIKLQGGKNLTSRVFNLTSRVVKFHFPRLCKKPNNVCSFLERVKNTEFLCIYIYLQIQQTLKVTAIKKPL